MAQSGAPVIAIDLGTAYTRVGFFDGEKPIIFPDEQGRTDIPSYVAFTNTGVLVGEKALDHAGKDPANTVFDIIRLLGRQFSDPTLQADMKLWPFNVVQGQDNKAVVLVQSKGTQCQFSPEEICSLILLRMKQIAEFRLGYADVISVVITVPVNFNHFQRQAIKDAASIASLNVERLISAPAAAAMLYNYNLDWSVKTVWNRWVGGSEHNLFVLDLGAGTLDVSIVSILDGKCQVRGTSGDDHLGGEDFDKILMNYLIANVLTYKQKKYIKSSDTAFMRLRQACERAKVVLSETVNYKLNISSLHEDECIRTTINDVMFKKLTNELVGKCIEAMTACIKEVGIDKRAIATVITVGGAAKIPRLQQCISRFFNNKDLCIENNYEGAVIRGASIHAFLLSGKKSDRVQSISLIDTSTFSFGIPLANGKMGVTIHNNTVLPTVNKILFHYNHYHQNLAMEVYEGKGYFTRQNTLINKLHIPGYSSGSECDYDVLFDMDASGILTVKAVDTSCETGNSVIIGNINHSLPTLEYSRKRMWDAFYSQEEVNVPNNLNIASSGVESYNSNNKKKETASEIAQGSKQSTKLVEPAIGIDLGTTCSCVGVWMRGRVEIIPNEYGSRTSLSCVAFPETGRLIGDAAKQQLTMNPANTIINVKRLIGRHKLDQNLQNYVETLPFKVKEDPKGRPAIVVQYNGEEKLFAPEEITAMMLRRIKEQAEDHTKTEVKDVVITVPSSFNDSQRKATRDAGLIAGLNILQLLNEPTAAAITYYLHKSSLESFDTKNVLVFDLGGGTFDVSVITVSKGKIQVIAVNGDSNLGGEDFDTILVNHFVKQFDSINLSEGKSVSKNPRSLRRLRAACEKAKRVLSTVPKTNIDLDALYEGTDFSVSITKSEFEALNVDLIHRCMQHVKWCLEDAKMERSNINDVVLVGGSTRIPLLQQTLQKFFDGKELCKSINQDEAVACGAAVFAAKLGKKDDKKFHDLEVQDVTSLSFGTENVGGGMHLWVPKYSKIPVHTNLVFTTTKDNMSEIPFTLFELGVSGKKSFVLSGIPPHSRGSTEMCVDLMIDSSGILNLSYNKVASQSSGIVVKELGSPNLIGKDIEEMTDNAVKFKADDDEQKQRAEAMNSMENIALSRLKEVASSAIEDSKKKAIEDETNKLLNWLDTHHNAKIEEINTKKQQWESLFQ